MRMKQLIMSFLICIVLCSCNSGVSKEKLASKVKAEINTEFSKRATQNNVSYTIDSFGLIHTGGNEYSGVLKTTEGGQEFTYQVNVTVDGDSYMWKIVE